jgi:uncharacterized BrkB/YihY/UPF0761 family membrane protein
MLMMATLLSFISLLIILSEKGWKWVRSDEKIVYSHSIIGMFVIMLAITQSLIGTFRPAPGTPKRKIFNFVHAIVGASTFTLAG